MSHYSGLRLHADAHVFSRLRILDDCEFICPVATLRPASLIRGLLWRPNRLVSSLSPASASRFCEREHNFYARSLFFSSSTRSSRTARQAGERSSSCSQRASERTDGRRKGRQRDLRRGTELASQQPAASLTRRAAFADDEDGRTELARSLFVSRRRRWRLVRPLELSRVELRRRRRRGANATSCCRPTDRRLMRWAVGSWLTDLKETVGRSVGRANANAF